MEMLTDKCTRTTFPLAETPAETCTWKARLTEVASDVQAIHVCLVGVSGILPIDLLVLAEYIMCKTFITIVNRLDQSAINGSLSLHQLLSPCCPGIFAAVPCFGLPATLVCRGLTISPLA